MLRITCIGVALVLASLLVGLAEETLPRSELTPNSPRRSQLAVDAPIPPTAKWSARWDHALDGVIDSDSTYELQLNLRNGNLTGDVSKTPNGDSSGSILSGEIIRRRPRPPKANAAILILREDHADGYFVINTARMVSATRFLGTWIDSKGQIGDFEMELIPRSSARRQ